LLPDNASYFQGFIYGPADLSGVDRSRGTRDDTAQSTS